MSNPIKKLICDQAAKAANTAANAAVSLGLVQSRGTIIALKKIQDDYVTKAKDILDSTCDDIPSLCDEGILLLAAGELTDDQEDKLITLDEWFIGGVKALLL